MFVLNLIAGSYQIALVPAWISAARTEEGSQHPLFQSSFLALMVMLSASALLMAAMAPLYLSFVAPALGPDTLALTADLLWVIALFMVMGGASIAWGGVLNAKRRFALPAIAPVLTPIVMMLFLIFGRDTVGISALAWGAVVGTLAEAVIVGIAVRRLNHPVLPGWQRSTPRSSQNFQDLASRWRPLIIANLLLGGAGLIDQIMAASLGPGSASVIGYGAKLVLAGLHVATLALGVAVLSAYSDTASRDPAQLRAQVRRHVPFVMFATLPIVLIAMWVSEPVISLLYQRGAFTAEDTRLVSLVLAAYVTQLPAYAATVILVRAAAVLTLGRAIATAAAVNVIATIGLNWLLMGAYGVVGIAAATLPAFILTAAVLYIAVERSLAPKMSEQSRR